MQNIITAVSNSISALASLVENSAEAVNGVAITGRVYSHALADDAETKVKLRRIMLAQEMSAEAAKMGISNADLLSDDLDLKAMLSKTPAQPKGKK